MLEIYRNSTVRGKRIATSPGRPADPVRKGTGSSKAGSQAFHQNGGDTSSGVAQMQLPRPGHAQPPSGGCARPYG